MMNDGPDNQQNIMQNVPEWCVKQNLLKQGMQRTSYLKTKFFKTTICDFLKQVQSRVKKTQRQEHVREPILGAGTIIISLVGHRNFREADKSL